VWLDLLKAEFVKDKVNLPNFPAFPTKKLDGIDTIVARSDEGSTYLCSVDGVRRMAVKISEKWPFDQVVNDHRFAFVRSNNGLYRFVVRDPRMGVDCFYDDGS
jgi:hypothetical protein